MPTLSELLAGKKNFLLIGETGSGKSEIALNVAAMLRRGGGRETHVFDLDQTKAMFRARDAEGAMSAQGIAVHYMPQLLDMPVLVNGIIPQLHRPDSACVLDGGGNENAARMIGCLSDHFNGDDTAALYVLNPYRPWSSTVSDLRETMEAVLRACHVDRVHFVANPNLGPETTREEFEGGLRRLLEELPEASLSGIFVREDLISTVERLPGMEYVPLHLYLIYPWNATG